MDRLLARRLHPGKPHHRALPDGSMPHGKPAGLVSLVYAQHVQKLTAAGPKLDEKGSGNPPKEAVTHRAKDPSHIGTYISATLPEKATSGGEDENGDGDEIGSPFFDPLEPDRGSPSLNALKSQEPECTKGDSGTQPNMVEPYGIFGVLRSEEGGELQGHLGKVGQLKPHFQWQKWVTSPLVNLIRTYGKRSLQPPSAPKPPQKFKIKLMGTYRGKKQGKRALQVCAKDLVAKLNAGEKGSLSAFEEKFFAKSSQKARNSRRKTIENVMGDNAPGAPNSNFDADSFAALAAALQGAGYKSVGIYVVEAKLMHIDAGGDWNPCWDRKFKLTMKAAKREVGPAKKAAEVPRRLWSSEETASVKLPSFSAKMQKSKVPKVHPMKALFAFAVAVHWMLREIEVSDLTASSFVLDHKNKTAELTLKKHKTDQTGMGTRRVLQCLHEGPCNVACPVFAAKALLGKARKDEALVTLHGRDLAASKSQLIAAWEDLFGKSTSGHSLRRSGALQYVRQGWSVAQVAYLGRWQSNVIYEYAKEALQEIPVNSSTNFAVGWHDDGGAKRLLTPQPVPGTSEYSLPFSMEDRLLELEAELEKVKGDSKTAQEELKKQEQKASESNGLLPAVVLSTRSKTRHWNTRSVLCSPPFTWKTKCGWLYGSSSFNFVDSGGVDCLKCISIAQSNEAMKGDDLR